MEINRKLLIKMLKIARKKQDEVNDLKDEIIKDMESIIEGIVPDLSFVDTPDSPWSDCLLDEIDAYIDYGEGNPETICDYLERFLEDE